MGNLRELVARYGIVAWRKRWFGLLAATLVAVTGWIGVGLLPDQYQANARIFIDADAFLTPLLRGIAVESSLQDELDLLHQMLLSRPNLERIISKTDLQLEVATPVDTERMVDRIGRDIHVVAQTRNIFTITYRNPSRQLASDVVQAMLASFIENKAGDNRDEIDKATVFIDGQIALYEQQLRQAEARRAAFKKKYIDLLPGDSGVNRLEAARQAVKQLTGELADARARRLLIANQLASTPAVLSEGGGGTDPQAQLRAAEARLRELRQIYTDAFPEVIAQQRTVDNLRRNPAAAEPETRGRSVGNPTYQQFRLQLVETDASIESLTRRLADAKMEAERLDKIAKGVPELEAQYIQLNRDYDIVRKNYDELVGRREGMRISDAAQKKASNIKLVIIDPPTVPRLPVGPRRVLFSIGVMVVAVGAGIGLVAGLVAFDQSFHTLTELRALGLPVIGSVSLAALPPSLWDRARSAGLFVTACLGLLLMLGVVLWHWSRTT